MYMLHAVEETDFSFDEMEDIEFVASATRSHERCHWGTPGCSTTNPGEMNSSAFVPQSKREISYHPPEGFVLAAHIVTDPNDGLSYFSDTIRKNGDLQKPLVIPYLECGVVGSTTEPIFIKAAYFRQFPQLAHPSTYSTSKEAKIIVALNRLEITVSGGTGEVDEDGETRLFEPGDVVLIEDLFGKGHKMRAARNSAEDAKDLSVLILIPTANHPYTPKRVSNRSSFSSVFQRMERYESKSMKPCEWETGMPSVLDSIAHSERNPFQVSTRGLLLISLGLSLSTMLTFFLSKVAPLQLAVGIGGACMIAGGTWGTVKLGTWLCDEVEASIQAKKLQKRMTKDTI